MDPKEREVTDPRPAESPAAFEARLSLLNRAGAILHRLTERGFTLIVESERTAGPEDQLESDFVLEYGDVRMRVLLCAREAHPLDGLVTDDRLRHYFLEVPDTDAVAVVADDAPLSTSVVDIYDAHDPTPQPREMRPLLDAIGLYFNENVFAVELPDLRTVLALPSEAELRNLLKTAIAAHFDRITGSRARVPEKVAALESLGKAERRRLIDLVTGVLDGHRPSVSEILERHEDDET